MSFRNLCSIALLAFSLNSYTSENNTQITLSIDSYNFSQAKYISDYIGDFSGIIKSGENAASFNKLTFDIHYGNFNIGVFKRLDHHHHFSSDTIKLQHDIKNNITADLPKTYSLSLAMEHFEASGIKLGYRINVLKNISLRLTGNYFLGANFHSGELTGIAEWDLNQDINIIAPTNIYSARNELLAFPKLEPNGEGYSVDLELNWQASDYLNIQLQANDAASQINWNNALLNKINRWRVYQLDSTGGLDTTPILEGRIMDYQQELIKNHKGTINLSKGNDYEYFSSLFKNRFFSHLQIGLKKHLNNNKTLIIAWHKNLKAYEIGIKTPYLEFGLVTDSISSKKSHVFNLNFGFSFPI